MILLTRKGRILGYNIYLDKWRGFRGWWGEIFQLRTCGFLVITRMVIPDDETAIILKELINGK